MAGPAEVGLSLGGPRHRVGRRRRKERLPLTADRWFGGGCQVLVGGAARLDAREDY